MRRRATIVALTLVVALTGCGVIPGVGPDPRVNAVPVDAVTCPETYDDGYAEAGLVPPDFAAVAILRCDPYASWQDADGTWSGAVLERLEGDLDPVLAALATPSDPLSIGACTTVGYILPELWVENEDGLVVRVALPSTGCGAPKSVGLNSALDTLTVVETTTASASLMESAAATAAGCASQAGANTAAAWRSFPMKYPDGPTPQPSMVPGCAHTPQPLHAKTHPRSWAPTAFSSARGS